MELFKLILTFQIPAQPYQNLRKLACPLIPGFAASSRVFITQFGFVLLNLCFPPCKAPLDLTQKT